MAYNGNVVEVLCDLIALPSVNPGEMAHRIDYPFGEGRVGDYVERFFSGFDVKIERQEICAGRANILVHIPGRDPDAPAVAFEAHMDTVSPGLMKGPFSPRVDGGRVYGRGACDTKASLAAMMVSAGTILDSRTLPAQPICLVGAVDEEFGALGISTLMNLGAQFAAIIVGEPTSLDIVLATNGQVCLQIVTNGVAAHSSVPSNGVNAIYIMNDVIHILRRQSEVLFPLRGHSLCGSPVLNVGIIRGGIAECIVPDRCEIAVDRRLVPGETAEEAVAEIRNWIKDDLGANLSGCVTVDVVAPPLVPLVISDDHALVKALAASLRATRNEVRMVGAPYTTDASIVIAGGIPAVVFGPGALTQAHTADEFVNISELVAATDTLRHLMETGVEIK